MECEKCKKETEEIWLIEDNVKKCEYVFCPKCAEKFLIMHSKFWHDEYYQRLTISKKE